MTGTEETRAYIILQNMPMLCSIGIAICSASFILNIWIFFVLRHLRTASSTGAGSDSGKVYNLALIRHLLLTDVITAVLIVTDLVLKAQGGQQLAPNLPSLDGYKRNQNDSNGNIDQLLFPSLPPLPPLPPLTLLQSSPRPPAPSSPSPKPPFNSSRPMAGYTCFRYFASQGLHSSHALTLMALTLIAIDLYIFIIRALSYRRAFIVRCLPRLLLASWTICLGLAALPIAYHAAITVGLPSVSWRSRKDGLTKIHYYCRFEPDVMDRFCCVAQLATDFYSLQIVLAVFLVSCCVITFCYARIVFTICRLAASAPGSGPNSIATTERQNVRGVATSVGLLLLFYALFLPYFTLLLITNMRANEDTAMRAAASMMENDYFNYYMEVVMATYTLFNPLVYACRLRAVRRRSSRTLAMAALGRRRTRDSAAQHLVPCAGSINQEANHQLFPTRHSRHSRSLARGSLSTQETQQRHRHSFRLPSKALEPQEEGIDVEQFELQPAP